MAEWESEHDAQRCNSIQAVFGLLSLAVIAVVIVHVRLLLPLRG
jgi:hypothetical protein